MARNISLGLVIGGAVSATVGAAFKTVENRIKKLEEQGSKAKVLKSTIGETMRLRDEWKRAHDSGAASAAGLLSKLERNLSSLQKQGVQVGKLRQEYQALGRVAKGADLQLKGHQQIQQGKEGVKSSIGQAVAGAAAVAIPTTISAGYQAIIRDIAIKGNVANAPEEAEMTRTVIQTSKDTGMARNDVAELVNQLVGAGMELDKALAYAPVAAKFAIGQGSGGEDTAKMIQALEQNAKITDPKVMEQALEAVALQGQAGSFEASDMARWFPQLLAGMGKMEITGMDAVTQLGSMLQVQMKTAGGSDEAANNLKNWMEKIGSGEVVKAYKDVGIDYQASLATGIQNKKSTLESSFELAMRYIKATDPAKAAKMAEAQAKISKETDPAKAKAMLNALEQSLRTGDLFADMQVKAALMAYSQNRELYEQLKKDSLNAKGILDKNLAERRETSAQLWTETMQAINDGMRAVGDALRPATDAVAKGVRTVAMSLTGLTEKMPGVVAGVVGVGAALVALGSAFSMFKMGKGLFNVARGSLMGNPNVIQRVFVTNAGAMGGGDYDFDGGRDKKGGKGAKGGKAGGGVRGRLGRVGRALRSAIRPGVLGRTARLGGAALRGATSLGLSALKSVGGLVKGMSPWVKGGGALAVLGAGIKIADTFQNAKTKDEKAEGYGGAAGGLAGAMIGTKAGMAFGAAIGTIVPGLGTAIGGAVGAVVGGALGYWGGDALGAKAGKALFGSDDSLKRMPYAGPLMMRDAGKNIPPVLGDIAKSFKASPAPLMLKVPEAAKPVMGQVVRSMAGTESPVATPAMIKPPELAKPLPPKVDQQFSFAPALSVTVQGDVKDPAQLARELTPHLRLQFDEYSRQAAARQLSDEPHV
ncbi:phage tail tape measure protein [Pseudomonas sessilinigenes]|uniref:Phage tail tape measure protein n=1 Tax=Pseudomonas sessilinigenes TaxID=658629 RepID=A0ABX8MU68_9PSED|nr:phage tail tape measure protein [Pseudomonas sessilinigenes]AZC23238.1 Phage protein [Pseudomonas sessilinigenes]QXH42252.1 phage tail tape measure protein [Pseudomonas sessilinigenes]